ncbi:biotin transporter BioY [Microvirga sp. W0021]|uniref:Biotin transporter n=1 Tax=Hohaiivirga grylli TaxID=3133970 RepID=A0ABV0BHF5_9HYPH
MIILHSMYMRPLAIIVSIAVLSIASRIALPVGPVPITLQTLAVTLTGAILGWRLGTLTIIIWLALAACGIPVLSGGVTGLEKFMGPTAGYLFAFPLAAAFTGLTSSQNRQKFLNLFFIMLIGNAICLFVGAGWLGMKIGFTKAIMSGVVPFLIGAIIKSAAAAAFFQIFARYIDRRNGIEKKGTDITLT